MKKYFALLITALSFFWMTFAFGNKQLTYELPNNFSSKIWTTPKLTWTNYMKALNSRWLSGVSEAATSAVLTTTLGKVGKTKINYMNHTYTVTVGYTSCKINAKTSRKELPKTITLDLTKVNCLNKKEPVNFLPLLIKGKKMNVMFAKINWTTSNTKVVIK